MAKNKGETDEKERGKKKVSRFDKNLIQIYERTK